MRRYFWQITAHWIAPDGRQTHNSYGGRIVKNPGETDYDAYLRVLEHLHLTYGVPRNACFHLNHFAPDNT